MINSKVENSKTDVRKQSLPALYRYVADGKDEHIVLFTEETKGIVILITDDTDESTPIGRFSTAWTPCFNPDVWRRLTPEETVTLNNE